MEYIFSPRWRLWDLELVRSKSKKKRTSGKSSRTLQCSILESPSTMVTTAYQLSQLIIQLTFPSSSAPPLFIQQIMHLPKFFRKKNQQNSRNFKPIMGKKCKENPIKFKCNINMLMTTVSPRGWVRRVWVGKRLLPRVEGMSCQRGPSEYTSTVEPLCWDDDELPLSPLGQVWLI